MSDESVFGQKTTVAFRCSFCPPKARNWKKHMGVLENGGFSPQIIHFDRVFHYKPSILGFLYFLETHPYLQAVFVVSLLGHSVPVVTIIPKDLFGLW